jgi:hypothetical protein
MERKRIKEKSESDVYEREDSIEDGGRRMLEK